MTEKIYVKDIAEGTEVDSLFLIKRADLRAKHGEQYIHLTIADKTGFTEAKLYGENAPAAARSIKTGSVYRIIGKAVIPPNGELYVFSDAKKSLDAVLAGPAFLGAGELIEYIYTPADIKGNALEIQKIVASITNPGLKMFVACLLDNRFYECPAAIRRHHEYTGGLCEHSLETARIALAMVDNMQRTKISRDMVIAGAVLHDIGKIFCFDKTQAGYVPNDTYNLVEHLTMGIMYIEEYKNLITEDQLMQIRHIIQSHHGTYGDVIPLTAEAWLVHHADTASSAMRSVVDDLETIPAGQKKKGLHSDKFLWKAV
ncbi:MAG TPA: HD domain-containing protein [Methanocorpusculum sp.]|nr:HD domain-containing protein [Methanocorpusculum sp.]